MTVDLCLTLCLENGHAYAGLQSGTECFCGNEDAVYQKLAKDETTCNLPCGGNPSQTCGGDFWANVYDLSKFISHFLFEIKYLNKVEEST